MQQQNLRYRPLWLALGWLLVAGVWYLSLIPQPPQFDPGIDCFDKISHFSAYATLMFWFMQLYQSGRTRLLYAFGFIAMGIAIEFLQDMGTTRLFEVADMLANALGVGVMVMLSGTRLSQLLRRIEKGIGSGNK